MYMYIHVYIIAESQMDLNLCSPTAEQGVWSWLSKSAYSESGGVLPATVQRASGATAKVNVL